MTFPTLAYIMPYYFDLHIILGQILLTFRGAE